MRIRPIPKESFLSILRDHPSCDSMVLAKWLWLSSLDLDLDIDFGTGLTLYSYCCFYNSQCPLCEHLGSYMAFMTFHIEVKEPYFHW